jgi:hypothetical protein
LEANPWLVTLFGLKIEAGLESGRVIWFIAVRLSCNGTAVETSNTLEVVLKAGMSGWNIFEGVAVDCSSEDIVEINTAAAKGADAMTEILLEATGAIPAIDSGVIGFGVGAGISKTEVVNFPMFIELEELVTTKAAAHCSSVIPWDFSHIFRL